MKLVEIFEYIEGSWFDAVMNALSGLNSFRSALEGEEAFQQLTDALRESKEHRQAVLQRFSDLLSAGAAPIHFQRYDAALACYLHALSLVDTELALRAAEQIHQNPHLFWARRLARHIREQATIP